MAKLKQWHMWERVHGPDLDQGKARRRDLNQATINPLAFTHACDITKTNPTTRQASKFRRGKGKAYHGA